LTAQLRQKYAGCLCLACLRALATAEAGAGAGARVDESAPTRPAL
jgi:hypothetical protein